MKVRVLVICSSFNELLRVAVFFERSRVVQIERNLNLIFLTLDRMTSEERVSGRL